MDAIVGPCLLIPANPFWLSPCFSPVNFNYLQTAFPYNIICLPSNLFLYCTLISYLGLISFFFLLTLNLVILTVQL